jgi:hypothetical protein
LPNHLSSKLSPNHRAIAPQSSPTTTRHSPPTIAINHGFCDMTYGCAGDAITSWLESVIEEQRDQFLKIRDGKRKRESDRLTPSPSSETTPIISAKRRRGEVADADIFATPRPPARALTDTSSTSSISCSDNSTGSISALATHSSSKTPIKQFQRMEVAARDPVRLRQLSVEDAELPNSTFRGGIRRYRDPALEFQQRGKVDNGPAATDDGRGLELQHVRAKVAAEGEDAVEVDCMTSLKSASEDCWNKALV